MTRTRLILRGTMPLGIEGRRTKKLEEIKGRAIKSRVKRMAKTT